MPKQSRRQIVILVQAGASPVGHPNQPPVPTTPGTGGDAPSPAAIPSPNPRSAGFDTRTHDHADTRPRNRPRCSVAEKTRHPAARQSNCASTDRATYCSAGPKPRWCNSQVRVAGAPPGESDRARRRSPDLVHLRLENSSRHRLSTIEQPLQHLDGALRTPHRRSSRSLRSHLRRVARHRKIRVHAPST